MPTFQLRREAFRVLHNPHLRHLHFFEAGEGHLVPDTRLPVSSMMYGVRGSMGTLIHREALVTSRMLEQLMPALQADMTPYWRNV
jgi:hypothetical protein